jgi:trk system potassium uptake protein TrkH
MDWRAVLYTLAHLALILALCLVAPLLVTFATLEHNPRAAFEVAAFAVPILLALTAWFFMRRLAPVYRELGRREGFAVVAFSWLLMVILGMLPYPISGTTASVTDAFFETMSGFTTTGATIFPKVEVIPDGVQFWRHMTQWLGGMGIIVLSVALLRFLGVGGYRLLKAETPGGVAFERERPRIIETAKDMWKLYLGISVAELLLLKWAGMSWYDACCHTFTTMSTGGFSPHSESIAFFPSPWIQWILIAFMFLAGINFSLYSHVIRLRPQPLLRNPEVRLYVAIMLCLSVVGVAVVPFGDGLEHHVRDVVFQVVSIGTTTGYATADFDQWPQIMRVLLLLVMFVGGCMGSTGGGMKVARFIVYAKAMLRELHRLVYPHGVRHIKVGDKVIDPKLVSNIMAFGFIWMALFILGTLVMAGSGYDLVTSSSASVAALGNIGPGLGLVGPTCNWAHLPDLAKWIMSLLMLLGRLEVFSVIVLATTWAWRR